MKRFYCVLKVIILLIAINMFSGVSAQESSNRNIKNSVFKNAGKSGEFVLPVVAVESTVFARIDATHTIKGLTAASDYENTACNFQPDNLLLIYCDASTSNEDEYISNVLMGSINKNSSWQGGVANYTNLSTTIPPEGSQQISVTNGTPYSEDQVTAWVDWNNDYTFATGANEAYILTNSGGTGASFVGNISVPAETIEGDYRMRIRMTYNTVPAPCGISGYGEIEDYTIKVRYLCPTAVAGPDVTIVEDQTCQLNGVATDFSSLLWTSSGDGLFDNTGILNPVYTPGPGDIAAGYVELCLHADPILPCSTSATSCMTLSFRPCSTANAGSDASICEGSMHDLAGTATSYSSLLWTSSGTGTFNSTVILNPIYTPSIADISSGKITLTLKATPIFPCTISASDSKNLVIKEIPAATAGDDRSI
ncbi:MAG: GEVED domain-containing protein, partial [Bacteroidales bacterium]